MKGAAKSARSSPPTKGFHIQERNGGVSRGFVIGIKHRLGAVQRLRGTTEVFEGMVFHI